MSALLLPNEILSMTGEAARRLLETGDGDCALLYLALLASGGDDGKAARRLNWQPDRLGRTYDRLRSLGLTQGQPQGEAPSLPPEPEPPQYSRKDVADALEREPEFAHLYRQVERLLNRPFTDTDLKSLYTIYDSLAMPAEVILMLTGCVVQTARRQRGGRDKGGARMSQVQRAAFRWKRMGLDSPERAEEYLRRQQQVDAREWGVLSAVGVQEPRAAVDREREYIDQWVSMGLSDELIHLAYQRTVYQKGQMNWPYTNKILQAWHQAGWRTPEQVEAGDKAPRRSGRSQAKGQAAGEVNYQPSLERIEQNADWLDKFLEEQQKGG